MIFINFISFLNFEISSKFEKSRIFGGPNFWWSGFLGVGFRGPNFWSGGRFSGPGVRIPGSGGRFSGSKIPKIDQKWVPKRSGRQKTLPTKTSTGKSGFRDTGFWQAKKVKVTPNNTYLRYPAPDPGVWSGIPGVRGPGSRGLIQDPGDGVQDPGVGTVVPGVWSGIPGSGVRGPGVGTVVPGLG